MTVGNFRYSANLGPLLGHLTVNISLFCATGCNLGKYQKQLTEPPYKNMKQIQIFAQNILAASTIFIFMAGKPHQFSVSILTCYASINFGTVLGHPATVLAISSDSLPNEQLEILLGTYHIKNLLINYETSKSRSN